MALLLLAKQLNYPLAFSALNSGITSNEIIMGVVIGFLLSCGALIGDIIGSFIKRRSNLKRGESFPLMDQLGFLVTALVFVYPVVPWPISWILILLPITLFAHIAMNLVSYNIGLQEARF